MLNDAVRAVAELAASQHRAITRTQAADLQFDHRRVATALRQGWLVEPFPGVLTLGDQPLTWVERLHAATLAPRHGAVASHRAAARLHHLDGFESTPHLELSLTRRQRWHGADTVVAHHVGTMPQNDVIVVDGIRSTTVARTLCDLGAVVPQRQVRRALTDVRRRDEISLTWVNETLARLHRPGPSGTGALLREVCKIPFEGRVSESWFEELLHEIVAAPDLPMLVRQHELRRPDGTFVARFDLAFPSIRLGVEAHSRRFHFGPDAEAHDEDRDLAAQTCGWSIAYLGWQSTRRPDEVVAVLRDIVATRRREIA